MARGALLLNMRAEGSCTLDNPKQENQRLWAHTKKCLRSFDPSK